MSTEIKPGQVWAWNDGRTGPGPEITVTSLGEYVGGDARVNYAYSGDLDVYDVDLASFQKKAHLVTDVDATPAPLDPSKVKAGDTVTVHVVTIDSPPYDVAGEAYLLGHALAVGGHVLTGPGVTLTAHTPAPEPEPEWEPGTVAVASVRFPGADNVVVHMINDATIGGAKPWCAPSGGPGGQKWFETSDLYDVRPLVVIDPSAVDVDALAEALRREWSGKDLDVTFSWSDIAKTVVSELGLDGAS